MYYQDKGSKNIFAGLQLAAVFAMAIALATAPLAHAQCDPPPNGTMVAWYPFDELAGPTSANLATQNTGVWSLTPPPIPGVGEVAGALNFGGNSYVDTPDSIVTNFGPAGPCGVGGGDYSTCQGNFSMDTWLNITVLPNIVETIVDKRDATPIGYTFYLYRNTGFSPNVYLGVQLGDSTGFTSYSFSLPILNKPGIWHHVAVTVNRLGKITYYLDGAPKGTLVPTQILSLENKVPLRIGANGPANGGTSFFNGLLDELEIYNRVLTAAEVKAIFAAGPAGKCKP
jgi:hypothetical protein